MKLLINEGGEIACAKHVPFAGSDSFVLSGWRAMRTSEIVDFRAELGRPPTCETCTAIQRRHAEGCHTERKSDECMECAS